MNAMINTPSVKTMSSIDLVSVINDVRLEEAEEACSKFVAIRHDTLMARIEKVLGKAAPTFIGTAFYMVNGAKHERCVYNLPRRESELVVMSESYRVQAKVYDRMTELVQSAPVATIPQSFAAALRLAADQQDTIAAQVLLIAAAAPAVEFVERYTDCTGLKGFRQVCKLLGANETLFREFLIDNKIMYRLGSEWMPHAAHMDTGRFTVKTGISDISGHAFNSAKFTPKGVTWIAGEFAKYNLTSGQA